MGRERMKGVSTMQRDGRIYFYAYVGGKRLYCGEGKQGKELAEARRSEYLSRRYKSRQSKVGIVIDEFPINTFKQLHARYFTDPDVMASPGYERKCHLLAHLVSYFKDRPLSQFERDDQSALERTGGLRLRSSGEIDMEIKLLRTMFRHALKSKKINPQVLPGEFVTLDEYPARPLISGHDFEKIVEQADVNFKDVLICGFESAMRSAEITNLKVAHVHLNVKHISGDTLDYIELPKSMTKGKVKRLIPVSARLKEVLVRRMQGKTGDDFVFTNGNGKNYGRSTHVTTLMQSCCARAKIPYGDKIFQRRGRAGRGRFPQSAAYPNDTVGRDGVL